MKRLILLILVLGLIVFAIGYERASSHRHRSFHATASYSRQADQQEYEAYRDADDLKSDSPYTKLDEELSRVILKDLEDAARVARESVADVPVPIVPGSRVTDAVAAPPEPRRGPGARRRMIIAAKAKAAAEAAPKIRKVVGQVSATEERAKADAFRQLQVEVANWLAPRVPSSWHPSTRQLDDMIAGVRITPIEKPYGTVYTAELEVDFSDAHRADLVHAHDRVVVHGRMLKLGGLLGFVLVCLAVVSGYIRTDEATKGYYTIRLRMAAAAGVGAAGVVIYQMLA